MAPANQPAYSVDEKVLCFHQEFLYEAKILDIKLSDPTDKKSAHKYFVHYRGWKRTWDDWVMSDRLRKLNEENRELAATLKRDFELAQREKNSKGKKRASDFGSSEDRGSSVPKGTKRGRDYEIERPEQFHLRPAVRIILPDTLKALLVDDWENITKNHQLVPLPSNFPVNKLLDLYVEEEKKKRPEPADVDVLEEVMAGIREYFDKCLGRILLYHNERDQYRKLSKKWETGVKGFQNKGPCDVYGPEHLARLFSLFPELLAQTNLNNQSTNRVREELSKFTLWLNRHSDEFFTSKYSDPPLTKEEAAQETDKSRKNTATGQLLI